MSLKSIELSCSDKEPNWSSFKHIKTIFEKIGFQLNTITASVTKGAEQLSFDDIDDITSDNFKNRNYSININLRDNKTIRLNKGVNIHSQKYQYLSIDGVKNKEQLYEIADFLGLEKMEYKKRVEKKVFIAFRFDEVGEVYANKVSQFLKLLDFEVVTGKKFSPESVAEKVKSRMDKQDIVIAIHTPGNDKTWITQETLLASINKPLIILKQKEADFKPGILNDHEYIEFSGNIETTFISILEGIQELGIEFKET